MIEYSEAAAAEVESIFPNLRYVLARRIIKGEMEVNAYYKQGADSQWLIEPYSPDIFARQILCVYDIEIDLGNRTSHGLPRVREVGGKIARAMGVMNKCKSDMHLFENGDCCLGMWDKQNHHLTLPMFVKNCVYPYFVWQGYYEQYEEIPPCGEYSHNWETAMQEYQQDKAALAKSSICICGSGKKRGECNCSS